ncbi:hypothetical protein LPN04_11000 [Rugamonas sp. A1-17]|nr:hypothetical protein [Rugamonas sp. A1-17]
MEWGRLDDVATENHLLYMVCMWIIAPYDNRPVDHFLKRILGNERGFGGDPGWEIEWMTGVPSGDQFRVWADKDVSGLDQEEAVYDGATFYMAARETLLAYAKAHPSRKEEIAEIIHRYGFNLK